MRILPIALVLCSLNAIADPITYLISGTVSGGTELIDSNSVNPEVPFTNEQFVLSLTTDTSNITVDGGVAQNPGFDEADAYYTFSNLGSGVFSPMSLAGCAGGGCGEQIYVDPSASTLSLRTDFGFFPIVVLTSPFFSTYSLTTLGRIAVTASSGMPDGNPVGIETSQSQYLYLDQFSDVTFAAVTETPEPAMSACVVVGLGAFFLFRLTKRKSKPGMGLSESYKS